ncbi:VG15 protein [Gordonibacter sp.]|uniref:VG15 protein n=1 Tax=Gordonibacter sp. TaxID=1968902 RepID=UPI002FC6D1A3
MEIPRKMLDQLTTELNAFSAAGRQMVLNALASAEWSDVSELRAIAVEVMEMVCCEMTDLASARSAEFYDELRTAAVGKRFGAFAESMREPKATEGAVKALIESVKKPGATDRFTRELTDRVDYEIKKSAGDCIGFNSARDPLKPRYARVPAGAETCSFCLLIASFGFVYGSSGHYHADCDCRIVPEFGGMGVSGYDPDGMYARNKKCLETLGGREGIRADWEALPKEKREAYIARHGGKQGQAFDAYVNKRLSAEIGTRDPKWFIDGARCEIAKEQGAKPLPKETSAANVLADNGFGVRFIKEVNKTGIKTADARLNGSPWEFKIPEKWNEKTVKNQMKRALGKGTDRLLLSGSLNGASLDDMETGIRRIFSNGEFAEIRQVLIVDHGGSMRRVVRA